MRTHIRRRVAGLLGFGGGDGGYHGMSDGGSGNRPKVIIVGSPNVGKSVIFNSLTGAHVTVSNYPGTTVTVSTGKAKIDGREVEVLDTPGMYSLLPITDEERVARSMLLKENPAVVLHVADGKHLERMLTFTMQLVEAGLPVVLAVNMMDEAHDMGIDIDIAKLEGELGIPVIATVATTGQGLGQLHEKLGEYVGG